MVIQSIVIFMKTWEVADAASDGRYPTKCRMGAAVERRFFVHCSIYPAAGNASDHTRAAEVLAVQR